MDKAIEITQTADVFLIIASISCSFFGRFCAAQNPIYIIDPEPVSISQTLSITHIQEKAVGGCNQLRTLLL